MKITVLGGGGVRTPLLVAAVMRRAARISLTELCLMDIDAEKLRLAGQLSRLVGKLLGSDLAITTTTDARAALAGARYVITSIRVGGEAGRVLDERIALKHGVLGQETTGPGGFAMALRSIPALLGYARLIDEVSPGAWMFNFTNPAGLATQALSDSGFRRTVGICDGANSAQHAAAHFLGVDAKELRAEVFGLNHLSWARRIWHNGVDVLPRLLADPAFIAGSSMNIFAPALIEATGMWMNEYLYYYHEADQAVRAIQADEMTRGEEVRALNGRLLEQLRAIDIESQPDAALRFYHAYNNRRSATYMHYARADAPTMDEADDAAPTGTFDAAEGEGYAGVALDLIEAMERNETLYTAVNVPNAGAIASMRETDVVEVSCVVDRDGVRPLAIGRIPDAQDALMRSVKHYERLTVEAALTGSRRTAILALVAHPLVLSYSLAEKLVDAYLDAHAPHLGDWR
ncbi:MAG: 6-phospho-beta-glucosidase [Anaerolineae bacterium]|nr:6-phospho-beta-glucosidase [Anaerolineae bacterium]